MACIQHYIVFLCLPDNIHILGYDMDSYNILSSVLIVWLFQLLSSYTFTHFFSFFVEIFIYFHFLPFLYYSITLQNLLHNLNIVCSTQAVRLCFLCNQQVFLFFMHKYKTVCGSPADRFSVLFSVICPYRRWHA